MVESFDHEDVERHFTVEGGQEQLRRLKEAQAAAAKEPLTVVEEFVAMSTKANYDLFKTALDKACDEIESVFNEQWIPEGDPAVLMQRFDNAKNFLSLADTYFMAVARPVIQACQVHIAHVAMVPAEPSAEERQYTGQVIVGRRIVCIATCTREGQAGLIAEYDEEDDDYLIKFDHSDPAWHARGCFELEK